MAIQTTNPTSDVTDRSARQLGQVDVTDSLPEGNYLPLILIELRRISLLLAEIGNLDIEDFNDVDDLEVDT